MALILGASFLGAALVLAVLWFISGYLYVFGLIALILSSQGLVWFIMGLCFYIPVKSAISKLDRLKKDGFCYDAEIVRLLPNYKVHIRGYVTLYAECIYKNQDKVCLIKSNPFLLDYAYVIPRMTDGSNIEFLIAKVYVNRQDPQDYSVEILNLNEMSENLKYDYDYR